MADALTSNAFVPISEADRATFRRNGFLLVRGALAAPLRARLSRTVDELYARAAEAGELPPDGAMRLPGLLHGEAFAELLDVPAVFPHIWGHLGWNIVVDHAHVDAGPPGPGWNPLGRRRDTEGPLLALEVGYVLSGSSPDGREPGDALIADRRLWRTHDHTPITGRTVVVGYTYRWAQEGALTEAYAEGLSPVRRQLLGHTGTGSFGAPHDDIPLRAELKRRGLLGGEPR